MSTKNNKGNESTSWQSGIKYTEKKYHKGIGKLSIVVIVAIVSALLGTILGAKFISSKYSNLISNYEEELNTFNQETGYVDANISKIADEVGPSIVGIAKSSTNWINEAEEGTLGSGVIIDKKGYVLTNYNVINDQKDIMVILSGGRRVEAEVVAKDYKSDIAIIKINVENLKPVKFGDSSKMKTGDRIIGIGNPLGEEFSGCVSTGIISAKNSIIKIDDRAYKVYQTDMEPIKGNSGGAALNSNGEVIGIINNNLNNSKGYFIMPINEAKKVIDDLLKEGKVKSTFIGVRTTLIDEEESKYYKVPIGLGVLEVVEGTTAMACGMKKGDIILSVDSVRISKLTDITDALEGKKPGDSLKILIYRDGKEVQINTNLLDTKS